MANTTQNLIFANCRTRERAEELRKAWTDPEDGMISFQKILPMPEELDLPESGDIPACVQAADYLDGMVSYPGGDLLEVCRWHGAPKYDSSNDAPFRAWLLLNGGDKADRGRRYRENRKKYGYPTWYGWRNEHWGVKWDASQGWYWDYNPSDINQHGPWWTLVLHFGTPWNAPVPIFEKLYRDNPDVEFRFSVEQEEDPGKRELWKFEGGRLVRYGTEYSDDYSETDEE